MSIEIPLIAVADITSDFDIYTIEDINNDPILQISWFFDLKSIIFTILQDLTAITLTSSGYVINSGDDPTLTSNYHNIGFYPTPYVGMDNDNEILVNTGDILYLQPYTEAYQPLPLLYNNVFFVFDDFSMRVGDRNDISTFDFRAQYIGDDYSAPNTNGLIRILMSQDNRSVSD